MLWEDTQLLSVAVMFLAGAGLAVVNDVLGLVAGWIPARAERRRSIRPILRVWDLVFWLVVTPCVFAAALVSDYGRLRVYVFAGLAAGAAAYLLLGRPFVLATGFTVRGILICWVTALVMGVARPVKAAWAGLIRTGGKVGGALIRAGRRLSGAVGRMRLAEPARGRGIGRWGGWLLGGFRRRPKE